jgi:hypothetical protein
VSGWRGIDEVLGATAEAEAEYQAHTRRHSYAYNDMHLCLQCEAEYTTLEDLQAHRKAEHLTGWAGYQMRRRMA